MALLFSAPAYAMCGPYDKMAAALKKKFKEVRVGGGVAKSGKFVVELWASPGAETFTVLTRSTKGVACLRVTGVDWARKPIVKAGESH